MRKLRALIFFVLLASMLAAASVTPLALRPRQTHASIGVPVTETNPLVIGPLVAEQVKEYGLDVALRLIARKLLFSLVNDTVRWIQGGGSDGGPRFVTDWKRYFANAADQASGILIEELELSEICDPFKKQLGVLFPRKNLQQSFFSGARCSIEDIVDDIDDFRRDFRNGSWSAYVNSALVPENNIYALFLQGEFRLLELEEQEKLAAEKSAEAGFLGDIVCTKFSKDGTTCLEKTVKTPGLVAGQAVGDALDTDFGFLEDADEISEIVASLTDAFINRLSRFALSGLLGPGDTTSGENFTPVDGGGGGGGGGVLVCTETTIIEGREICTRYEDTGGAVGNPLGCAAPGVTCTPGDPTPPPFDVNNVVWLHGADPSPDPSQWSETSRIKRSDVSVAPGEICVPHSKAGQWPVFSGGALAEGNPWVFAAIDDVWYAGTYEWLRPGQVCKKLDSNPPGVTISDKIGPSVKTSPLGSWRPARGEKVGLMMSTRARDAGRTSNERSNIVFIDWPLE